VENPGGVFDAFERKSFSFPHAFAGHPLFDVGGLRELARRLPNHPGFLYWQNGHVDVGGSWGDQPAQRLTLDQTFETIATNDSLIILKHAEQDPIYGPVLNEILTTIYNYAPASVRKDIVLGESLIFINSPKRKTIYHFDLESTVLLQVQGEKFVSVFDQTDRSLISDDVLEEYCAGNLNAASIGRRDKRTRRIITWCPASACISRAPRRIGCRTATASRSRSTSTTTCARRITACGRSTR
jgi:hypothetical protein